MHTSTVYVPVVSPPTPAPSPGPPAPHVLPACCLEDADRSEPVRREFLSRLLASCTAEELLFISAAIAPRLKRDFLFCLPPELALYVLGFIDGPQTLARCAQVSRHWRTLVGEESVWRRMCLSHGFDDWTQQQLSYKAHFRACYVTMANWRRGGHLLRAHRIPVVTPESGVVTSLALDADWVVVGLANARIQIYSARTGVLAKTLVGHDLGVWSVCLVSKGGWMARAPDPSQTATATTTNSTPPGRSRRRSARSAGALLNSGLAALSLDSTRHHSTPPGSSRVSSPPSFSPPSGLGPDLRSLPAPLRIAIGLGLDDASPAFPCSSGAAGILDEDALEEELNQTNHTHSHNHNEGSSDDTARGQAKRKYSDMCHSSTGWGQPNSIVVSGGCDKVIIVWDVKTGHCIYRLSGHTSTIRCIRVLQNRPLAVSGSRDTTLRVWDIQHGKCLRVLRGHTQSVRCIDVAGNRVVSGSYDTTCRVWDVDTGACVFVLQGHFHQIYSVAFDARYVASGGLDTTVRLWDAETGNCIALLQGHTALVCQLQLSPTLLITGGSDGRVITFSLETLKISHRIAAHDCSVTSLQFVDVGGTNNNNNNFLVTGGNDGRVRLYEVDTGNYVRDVSEGGESVWRVCVGWGVCVVVCKRGGKTVVEIWSMRPDDDDDDDDDDDYGDEEKEEGEVIEV